MNINCQYILNQVRNNSNMMNNKTVQSVFSCLENKDHNALIEIYKNTCNTVGQQPNQMFLR